MLGMFVLCVSAPIAKADICIYNSKEVAEKALLLLKNNEDVVYFCPTCTENHKIVKRQLEPEKVVIDNEGVIFYDEEEVDIAYIYLPTKDKNIYQNLGYMVQCADFSETGVRAFLDVNKPYGIAEVEKLRKKLEKCDDNGGYLKTLQKENLSSAEYLTAYNDYVMSYQDCLKEVFDAAVIQFYPDKISLLKENFEELLMSARKYYLNFDESHQASEYEAGLRVNRVAEYVISILLDDVGG